MRIEPTGQQPTAARSVSCPCFRYHGIDAYSGCGREVLPIISATDALNCQLLRQWWSRNDVAGTANRRFKG
jgi:hypothetical protein